MPISSGASADKLGKIGRWSLQAMILTAPLALWWPTIRGWAVLVTVVLAIWLLWFCWRMTAGRRDVPGHLLHLVLAGVLAAQGVHLVLGRLGPAAGLYALRGEFNVSFVVHISLIALLIMLVQDLLPPSPSSRSATALGAVTLCAALIGLTVARPDEGRPVLGVMGWTGVALFFWPVWQAYAAGHRRGAPPRPEGGRQRLRALAALAAAVGLAILSPLSVPVVTGAAAVTMSLAACCLPAFRRRWAAGALAAWVCAWVQAWTLGWLRRPDLPSALTDWLGRGEQALLDVTPWDSGLTMLIGAIGWAGTLWLLAGLTGCLIWALTRARSDQPGQQAQALLTTFVAVLAAAAWLCPGGLFNPAVNVVFAVVWAVLPQTFRRRPTRHSGWWLLAASATLSLTLGLAPKRGLTGWTVAAYDRGEITLHVFVGGMLTLTLLWLMGTRRLGLVLALLISAAAGGAGEFAQHLLSSHPAEKIDMISHMVGVVAALGLYSMCRASLWYETADATPARNRPDGPPPPAGADTY